MEIEHIDVLIVGAGLSGICTAYYLQKECPGKSYALLESRTVMGGTWDLFRYPGVRSDSDMYTLGYSFRPWTKGKALAQGDSILAYLQETAAAYGIDHHIRYQHRVCRVSWSSQQARWTVDIEVGADRQPLQLTCHFLHICSGYYNYEQGHAPTWAGMEHFQGQIIHPQHWQQDLDYRGKRVVIIGSGATAVTLVPTMAQQAAHVTMLQRSPTYVVSMPSESAVSRWLRKLPAGIHNPILRWRSLLYQMLIYTLARRYPQAIKRNIIQMIRDELGPTYDVEKHFTPSYNPWDQRLCLVPDSDLFQAIRSGKAEVVTDQIETFTENGIRLQSGQELVADLIVTATGLKLLLVGGMEIIVDGKTIDFGRMIAYRGAMFSNIPNLVATIGYTNASWTLKAELIANFTCRMLRYMDRHGYIECRPILDSSTESSRPVLDFQAGYILRDLEHLPKQGTEKPWLVHQNYIADIFELRYNKLDDGTMRFRTPTQIQQDMSR